MEVAAGFYPRDVAIDEVAGPSTQRPRYGCSKCRVARSTWYFEFGLVEAATFR